MSNFHYELLMRTRKVGGAVSSGTMRWPAGAPSPLHALNEFRIEKRLTFLFHGYNVNEDKGSASLGRLAAQLPAARPGATVAVLWPGDHWVRAISYPFEGNDADDTAAKLAKFIDTYASPDAELAFVSHSLGARVAMGTIGKLAPKNRPVTQVCLMAAAVDNTSLSREKFYRTATEYAGRVGVLSSVKDKTLKWAYPAGDLLQAFLYPGDDDGGSALGLRGPKKYRTFNIPLNVHRRPIDETHGSDHGDYVPDATPNPQQLRACGYANGVLQGVADPQY